LIHSLIFFFLGRWRLENNDRGMWEHLRAFFRVFRDFHFTLFTIFSGACLFFFNLKKIWWGKIFTIFPKKKKNNSPNKLKMQLFRKAVEKFESQYQIFPPQVSTFHIQITKIPIIFSTFKNSSNIHKKINKIIYSFFFFFIIIFNFFYFSQRVLLKQTMFHSVNDTVYWTD
jgi:hypothetical protein